VENALGERPSSCFFEVQSEVLLNKAQQKGGDFVDGPRHRVAKAIACCQSAHPVIPSSIPTSRDANPLQRVQLSLFPQQG
jgi:hypothetical protein